MVKRGSGSPRLATTSTRRPVSAPGCAVPGTVTSKRGGCATPKAGSAAAARMPLAARAAVRRIEIPSAALMA